MYVWYLICWQTDRIFHFTDTDILILLTANNFFFLINIIDIDISNLGTPVVAFNVAPRE